MFSLIGKIQDKFEQKKGYRNGIILGKRKGKVVIDESRNSIFAITEYQSGIFTSSIIPTILNWQKNLIILDIKDEFYNLTSKYRKSFGQEVIKVSKENIDEFSSKIEELLTKNNYSIYICISSFENSELRTKIKFLIEKILKNSNNFLYETLFILTYFNKIGKIDFLKEKIYLERNQENNLKLFLISDIVSLLEFKYDIPILFGKLKRKLLFLKNLDNVERIKFLELIIENTDFKINDILYIDGEKKMKLERLDYYKEPYFIKKIK